MGDYVANGLCVYVSCCARTIRIRLNPDTDYPSTDHAAMHYIAMRDVAEH